MRVTIYMTDPSLWDEIKTEAAKLRVSVSQYLRDLHSKRMGRKGK